MSLFDEIVPFVQQVYFPDACAIAGFYPEWFGIGAGVRNYLAVPDLPVDGKATAFDLRGPGRYPRITSWSARSVMLLCARTLNFRPHRRQDQRHRYSD